LGDGGAGFVRSTGSTSEDIDGIPREVLEQKPKHQGSASLLTHCGEGGERLYIPSAAFSQGALVCAGDGGIVQPVEGHGG
jgi:hypothetical protein